MTWQSPLTTGSTASTCWGIRPWALQFSAVSVLRERLLGQGQVPDSNSQHEHLLIL